MKDCSITKLDPVEYAILKQKIPCLCCKYLKKGFCIKIKGKNTGKSIPYWKLSQMPVEV